MGERGSVGVKESSKQTEVRKEVRSSLLDYESGKISKQRWMMEQAMRGKNENMHNKLTGVKELG